MQQIERRDQQQPLPQGGEHRGPGGTAGRLQKVGAEVVKPQQRAGCQQPGQQLPPQGQGFGVGQKQPKQCVLPQQAGGCKGSPKPKGQPGQPGQRPAQPRQVAGPRIVGQQRLDAHTDPHLHQADHHRRLVGGSHGGQRRGAVACQHPVAETARQPGQQTADPVGQPQRQHPAQPGGAAQRIGGGQAQSLGLAQDVVKIDRAGHKIPQHGGRRRAGNAPPEHQNEQRVQHHVGHTAGQVPHQPAPDSPVRPQQGGGRYRKDHGRGAQRQNAQIRRGVWQDFGIGPEHPQQRRTAEVQNHRQHRADQNGAPAAQAGHGAHVLLIAGAQRGSCRRAAAHPQHGGPGRSQREHRADHRYGGGLGGILQKVDEKQVGHVVDDHDQHRQNRGPDQREDGLPDRCFSK